MGNEALPLPVGAILASEHCFWRKVRKGDGCWEWTASRNEGGYGQHGVKIGRRGRSFLAHRVSWVISTKENIPRGLCVLHRCDNPSCVRPDHLFLGTLKENAEDMAAKGRARNGYSGVTRCKHGHLLDEANTLVRSNGTRQCRICKRERSREYKLRRAMRLAGSIADVSRETWK